MSLNQSRLAPAFFALLIGGCAGDASPRADAPILRDLGTDAARDALGDGPRDAGAQPDVSPDMAVAYVPTAMTVALIAAGPDRQTTPPTWNANLPKLVADGQYFYAAHTHFTADVATRYAAILRRARSGGAFSEVARINYVHQPPGIAFDAQDRLHLVFDCLRPAGQPVTCFAGGAGTGGLTSRFYHLVFSARDAQGALRFDTYANRNEWTAESNGYLGLGTTPSGRTVWSLADGTWGRVVQTQDSAAAVATISTLTVGQGYLLYPIHHATATTPEKLLMFAGEFDPSAGNNAAYLAATAYQGSPSGLTQLFRRTPGTPQPGKVGAFPSSLAFDAQGTLLAVVYRVDGSGGCSELLRFDGGLGAAPTVLPLGCLGTYAKLQVSSAGTYYLVDGGVGATLRLGVSADRGTSWAWHDIPLTGLPANGDISYIGYTPITPSCAAKAYAPDVLRVFFAGVDGSGGARHSYFGELQLKP